MRVALVHYWLVNMRGGEKVLESFARMFPQADIFTHVAVPERLSETLRSHTIRTTAIARLPFATRFYPYYLPLMPLALEQIDLRGYDLIISSEAGPAKGIIASPDAHHLCYCHSPMRYIWDLYPEYAASLGLIRRALAAPMMHYLRLWDYASAQRVDQFVVNSHHVRGRVAKCYRRDADVVPPPVDVDRFGALRGRQREDFYLVAGQLVPYKRVEVAVEAFTKSGRRLVVIGEGPEFARLRRIAGPNVEFLGWQPNDVLADHLSRCRALVFPGEEDFGIVPVEAMATGAPVLAYGRGGVLDTVIDGVTGVLFPERTAESLADALSRFEAIEDRLDADRIAVHAAGFASSRFEARMHAVIARLLEQPGGPAREAHDGDEARAPLGARAR